MACWASSAQQEGGFSQRVTGPKQDCSEVRRLYIYICIYIYIYISIYVCMYVASGIKPNPNLPYRFTAQGLFFFDSGVHSNPKLPSAGWTCKNWAARFQIPCSKFLTFSGLAGNPKPLSQLQRSKKLRNRTAGLATKSLPACRWYSHGAVGSRTSRWRPAWPSGSPGCGVCRVEVLGLAPEVPSFAEVHLVDLGRGATILKF